MKPGLTELVFILDKSGSMHRQVDDTIGGFNSVLAQQQGVPGECKISTVLFDSKVTVLHDRVDLQSVQPMTPQDYRPGGNTALVDALGSTIVRIGQALADTPEEERPSHVLFVIITDGQENASREFQNEQVKQMVQEQTEKYDWEFIFLGADMDAIREANRYGIDASHSTGYRKDARGNRLAYETVSAATSAKRMSAPGTKISPAWKAGIEADLQAQNPVDLQRKVMAAYLDLAKEGKWTLLLQLWQRDEPFARACAAFAKPGSRWTFLHQAAFQGNVGACVKLTELGADRNALTVHGETPARVAADQGFNDLAAALQ